MALDYKQSADLRSNLAFQGRIASAMIKWADSILLQTAANLTQPNVRGNINYAEEIYANANVKAAQIQPLVVQDPAVQASNPDPDKGSTITDAALQSATEIAISKINI